MQDGGAVHEIEALLVHDVHQIFEEVSDAGMRPRGASDFDQGQADVNANNLVESLD